MDNKGRKNVLITGSSNGIGAQIAIRFAENGYNVGLTYRNGVDAVQEVKQKCESFGVKVEVYKVELADRNDTCKLMEDFLNEFGNIDVLVNNAGGALKIPAGEFEDLPLDYWDSQIALNLSAPAYCAQYAIKDMKKNNVHGSIINISSVHGTVTWVKRKCLPYCAAKGGLDMLTKALGVEVAPYGIRVNGIAPGFISTKATTRYTEEQKKRFTDHIPTGTLGETNDIAEMCLYLADEQKSKFIVGQTFHIDGGQSVTGMIVAMKEEFEK